MTSNPPGSGALTASLARPTVWRSFLAVAQHTFWRQARIRQMTGVTLFLLILVTTAVGIVGQRPGGWGLPQRKIGKASLTYDEYARSLLPPARYATANAPFLLPRPWDPIATGVQSLILSIPYAVLQSEKFLADWQFLNYSRWVVNGIYLGFILPLLTLAYASAAIGAEREGGTLVWLRTRPMPRGALYLACFLGTMPWCLALGLGSLWALAEVAGTLGRQAFAVYWPAALLGTIALAALFHLFGAVLRRPVVAGLIYVFFYETLVASLPGSLKKFSITFYTRSLMHAEAQAAQYPGPMLDLSVPVSASTAVVVLTLATLALLALGCWWFARSEPTDDL